MEEGLAKKSRHQQQVEDEADVTLAEFRKPRNSLLCVVSAYFSHASVRIKELRRLLADPSVRSPEMLDHKAHNVRTHYHRQGLNLILLLPQRFSQEKSWGICFRVMFSQLSQVSFMFK